MLTPVRFFKRACNFPSKNPVYETSTLIVDVRNMSSISDSMKDFG